VGCLASKQDLSIYEGTSWTLTHHTWLRAQRFDWQTLQQTMEGYLRALDDAEARLEILDQQVLELATPTPTARRCSAPAA
jgi:hypothetical protein